jgi:hypothetical protein
MDEKILDLLTGLSNDMREMKVEIREVKADIQGVKESQARLENDLTTKITALFDARECQKDVNNRVLDTLERIEAKVEVLQLETAHIRRVK